MTLGHSTQNSGETLLVEFGHLGFTGMRLAWDSSLTHTTKSMGSSWMSSFSGLRQLGWRAICWCQWKVTQSNLSKIQYFPYWTWLSNLLTNLPKKEFKGRGFWLVKFVETKLSSDTYSNISRGGGPLMFVFVVLPLLSSVLWTTLSMKLLMVGTLHAGTLQSSYNQNFLMTNCVAWILNILGSKVWDLVICFGNEIMASDLA